MTSCVFKCLVTKQHFNNCCKRVYFLSYKGKEATKQLYSLIKDVKPVGHFVQQSAQCVSDVVNERREVVVFYSHPSRLEVKLIIYLLINQPLLYMHVLVALSEVILVIR